jgi:hypothetical protein
VALTVLLDRWTGDITKGAKHATIALEWSKQLTAAFAVVEKLAGIGGHLFLLCMTTLRTGQR